MVYNETKNKQREGLASGERKDYSETSKEVPGRREEKQILEGIGRKLGVIPGNLPKKGEGMHLGRAGGGENLAKDHCEGPCCRIQRLHSLCIRLVALPASTVSTQAIPPAVASEDFALTAPSNFPGTSHLGPYLSTSSWKIHSLCPPGSHKPKKRAAGDLAC